MAGAFVHVYENLMGRTKEDGTMLFSVVHSDSTLRNEHKQKNRKFHLNTYKESVFTVRMVEHWNRLTRDVVEFTLKTQPDTALSNLF